MIPPDEPIGVLAVNLGTPDAPETGPVRRYLREFLSDPRVVDLPALARWLLLHVVILPWRPSQSAAAYRKVWGAGDSPLRLHGRALVAGLSRELGDSFEVALAMRYGRPSVAEVALTLARRCQRLVVLPLYPHGASSSTGSTLQEVHRVLGSRWNVPATAVVPPFHADPGFLESWLDLARPALAERRPDHVLFSFHGLPERQVRRADEAGGRCLADAGCCDALGPANARCYRAQCLETARRLAAGLELDEGAWSAAFQSRLGRTPWIGPHTDRVLVELAARGVRRLVVLCPGFVADCLETLEEIGLRGRDAFLAAGGEELHLLPCLNDHPAWIVAAASLVRRASRAWSETVPSAPALERQEPGGQGRVVRQDDVRAGAAE